MFSGEVQIDGAGFRDYSEMVKDFRPELVESMNARFSMAIEEIVTESDEAAIFNDRKYIFDFEDGWRLYVHRCPVVDYSGQVISLMAYHAHFYALPMPLQCAKVLAHFVMIAGENFLEGGEFIRSWPGHVAFMWPVKEGS